MDPPFSDAGSTVSNAAVASMSPVAPCMPMANPMLAMNPMVSGMGMPTAGFPSMMNPMMANPMLAMNPMMAGAAMNPMAMMMANPMMNPMMQQMAMTGMGKDTPGDEVPTTAAKTDDPIHPEVMALCRDYRVEDRLMRKLNLILQRRPETFADDIRTLREKLKLPRAEIGVLMLQLERGSFVNQSSVGEDILKLVDKYGLDSRAKERLVESMSQRKATRAQDMAAIDERLVDAERPSGLLMKLLQSLDTEGKMPHKPGSGPGVTSGHRPPAEKEERKSRSRKRKSRSKSRSRRRRR